MLARNYERIVNTTVVAAVISALLFDHSGPMRWVFGVAGIVCAFVAAVIYFSNQWSRTRSDAAVEEVGEFLEKDATDEQAEAELLHANSIGLDTYGHLNIPLLSTRHIELRSLTAAMEYNLGRTPVSRILYAQSAEWNLARRMHRPYPDDIVKIVDALCETNRDSFEFVIALDGTFTIRRTATKDTSVPETGNLFTPVHKTETQKAN